MPDVIITKRMLLTAADTAMSEARLEYYRKNREYFEPYDPEVCEESLSMENQLRILNTEKKLIQSGLGLYLYCFLRDDPDRLAGTISFSHFTGQPLQSAVMGYDLSRELWGMGYATEACLNALKLFIRTTSVKCLLSYVSVANTRSIALLERLGFQKKDTTYRQITIHGVLCDQICYCLSTA